MLSTKNYLFILLLSFCCLSLRCASSNRLESANVNQNDIYENYSIRRDKDSLAITAIFRVNDKYGNTLALTSPSRVTYNDKEMKRRDVVLSGVTYDANADSYQATSRFTFTDMKGKAYTNSITLDPVEFAVEAVQLKKSATSTIAVTHVMKDGNADLKLIITDSKNTDIYADVHSARGVVGFRNSVYFNEAKRVILIEPHFIKNIPEGEVTVALLMRKDKGLEQATPYDEQINLEYKSNPIKATVSSK